MLRHDLEPRLLAVVFFLSLMKAFLKPSSDRRAQFLRERYPLSMATASILSNGSSRSNRLSWGESLASPEITSMFDVFNSGS